MRLGRPTPCICASLDGDRVIHEGSVNLTRWLAHANLSPRCPEHQRRFSRWLHNARIHPTHLYSPLIQAALAGWEEQVLTGLDTTMLWDKFCVIRLSVVYRVELFPYIWRCWSMVVAVSSSSFTRIY